ncbi:MAG: glycogen synthase, partial [Lachnospiraceae bacterium]|nr:glycogen synthase [Lachnospiraceae bacterium]
MTNVLIATSEAVPFIKTGGLADVTGSLPKYLDKSKYDVRVIIPKYQCINKELVGTLKYVKEFHISLSWRDQYVGLYEAEYDGIHFYFIDNQFYFSGDKPYSAIYQDAEKFAYFDKAVLDSIKAIGFKPDIIHCNDWQTGLIPVFLKEAYTQDPFYKNIKCVYSIHNMKFQGRWRLDEVRDVTGLPDVAFTNKILESYSEANYLKGGIVCSEAVTTVSPTYAEEITTPMGGEGLDGVMREVKDKGKLYGILNGIDYSKNNPETDEDIDFNYTSRNVKSMKAKNKKALQKELSLPEDSKVFLIGIVSRLTDQKGFDLLAYILYEFL